MVVHRDSLGPENLLDRHWEKGSGLYGCVIGDDHEESPPNLADTCDDGGSRRSSPFFIHPVCCEETQLEEFAAWIDQLIHPLAGCPPPFFMLSLYSLRA